MQNTNISNIVISISSICQNNGGVEGGGVERVLHSSRSE